MALHRALGEVTHGANTNGTHCGTPPRRNAQSTKRRCARGDRRCSVRRIRALSCVLSRREKQMQSMGAHTRQIYPNRLENAAAACAAPKKDVKAKNKRTFAVIST